MISRRSQFASPNRSRGVALAIVLWFVAGMSMLVAGVVFTARTDTRLAQIHLERARAIAAGDGAIRLLMADFLEGRFGAADEVRMLRANYEIGRQQISVAALPEEWLVDINRADPLLLSRALSYGTAIDAAGAAALAEAVVQWRSGGFGVGVRRFRALEDLFAVEGMNRTSFESLRDYVSVSSAGSGLREAGARSDAVMAHVHALSPPLRVLPSRGPVPERSFRNVDETASGFRVDAIVSIDGNHWLRRRWVSLGTSGTLPWTVRRSEPARIIPRSTTRRS